ncbi:hypothetical protein DL96DRAFT_1619676 [Flagelloscypha sp. PMI_526]|nr:hypothetical protein DL96DRAFT_1619676 [Flagelloscypha sp. PMI_526]
MGFFSLRRHSATQPVFEADLPSEVWLRISSFLSTRELEKAAFLHPSLTYLVERSKYKKLSIPITFSTEPRKDWSSSVSTQLAQLSQYKTKDVAKHTQALEIIYHIPSQLQMWARRLPRWLRALTFSTNTPDLSGFPHIESLQLLPRVDGKVGAPTTDIPPHPFTSLVWKNLGSRLTSLSIEVYFGFHRLGHMLPPKDYFYYPLPCLEQMTILINVIWDKQVGETHLLLHSVARLYLKSRTLKKLSLQGIAINVEVLELLLPHSDENFPELVEFNLERPWKHGHTPQWDALCIGFLSSHASRLQSLGFKLQLSNPSDPGLSQWLETNLPSLCALSLRLELLYHEVDLHTYLLTASPQNDLLARTLTVLECSLLMLRSIQVASLLKDLAVAAPSLERLSLAIGSGHLSANAFVVLATKFPGLDSLMLWVSSLGSDDEHAKDITFEELWDNLLRLSRLYDIYVGSPSMTKHQTSQLLNLLAVRMPSIGSFNRCGELVHSS